MIWRFEKGNFSRQTNLTKAFIFCNGQLLFTDTHYPLQFNNVFSVKVGAVSGNDKIFTNENYGNVDFVCSSTHKTGQTKKMIFNIKNDYLEKQKDILLKRRIRRFDQTNWWQWGRLHCITDKKRVYVNTKTRTKRPFFFHECKNYDGSVLALFPKNPKADEKILCQKLNSVNWFELGFVCDGRYLFSQKSLENSLLPDYFREDIYKTQLF